MNHLWAFLFDIPHPVPFSPSGGNEKGGLIETTLSKEGLGLFGMPDFESSLGKWPRFIGVDGGTFMAIYSLNE